MVKSLKNLISSYCHYVGVTEVGRLDYVGVSETISFRSNKFHYVGVSW